MPQTRSYRVAGGKAPRKDLKSTTYRRRAHQPKPKSKHGKIRRPRHYKPGSKYDLITLLTIANCSQLLHWRKSGAISAQRNWLFRSCRLPAWLEKSPRRSGLSLGWNSASKPRRWKHYRRLLKPTWWMSSSVSPKIPSRWFSIILIIDMYSVQPRCDPRKACYPSTEGYGTGS